MGEKRSTNGSGSGKSPAQGYRRVIVFAVVFAAAVVLLSALLLPLFFEYYVDGFSIHQRAHDANVREILWESPKPLSERIGNLPENYEPALSADGLTLIFTGGKASANAELFVSRKQDRTWSDPVPLEAVNTEYDELGPELSRDGQYLYFYSNRPGGIGNYDLWVSRWNGEGWNAAENLGPGVNSEFNEYGPGLSADGSRLYFSSNRLERELTQEEKDAWKATLRENFLQNDYDIFCADATASERPSDPDSLPSMPRFESAWRVDILNSTADEGQVSLTPRNDFLYFSSNRWGGSGRFDLYRSRILHGELQEPENLGEPVNSRFDEMDPFLTLEGYGLVFSSNRTRVADRQAFEIYQTFSREVITDSDYSALSAFFRALDKIKWPLLILLLGLLALLYLLRYLRNQRFGMYASLLHRCLLASLLIHLLLALLTTTWMVGSSLYDMAWDDQGELCLNLDALAEEQIGLDIREQVAELNRVEDRPMEIVRNESMALSDAIEPMPLKEIEFAAHVPAVERFEFSMPMASLPVVTAELTPSPSRPEILDSMARLESRMHEPEPNQQEAAKEFSAPNDAQSLRQRAFTPQENRPDAQRIDLPEITETGEVIVEPELAEPLQPRNLPEKETRVMDRDRLLDLADYTRPIEVEEREMEEPVKQREAQKEPDLARAVETLTREVQSQPVPLSDERYNAQMELEPRPVPEEPLSKVIDEARAVTRSPMRERTRPLEDENLALMENPVHERAVPTKVKLQMEMPDPQVSEVQPELSQLNPDDHLRERKDRSETTDTIKPERAEKLPVEVARLDTDLEVTPAWAEKPLPRRLEHQDKPVELQDVPVVTQTLTLPPKQKRTPRLEQFEKRTEQAVAQKKVEDEPLTRFMRERNPLIETEEKAPAPVPKVALKLDPPEPRRSALDRPPRADRSNRMPDVARFEHDTPPTYHGLEMRSRRVVFCLDVSSSMEWNNRIGEARDELLRLLDTLDESVKFNIITFSGRVRVWDRRGMRFGSQENVESAKRFVRKARIASDGTNTVDALMAALSDKEVESIFFLSDGHPTAGPTTDNDEILFRVRTQQYNHKPMVKIHTIAYIKGDPPRQWRHRVPPKDNLIDLMTRLAEENQGNCVVFDEKTAN